MPPKPTKRPPPLPEDDDAFARLPTVLSVFPVSENSWWKGIAEGRYPRGVKLGKRITAWRVRDIRALLASVRDGDRPEDKRRTRRPRRQRPVSSQE
jgi:prophage regulatory protein